MLMYLANVLSNIHFISVFVTLLSAVILSLKFIGGEYYIITPRLSYSILIKVLIISLACWIFIPANLEHIINNEYIMKNHELRMENDRLERIIKDYQLEKQVEEVERNAKESKIRHYQLP